MNENIFREYDIRGVVATDFTADTVIKIAKAFSTMLVREGFKNCVVGFDARLSADFLFSTFANTLRDCGVDVISIGQCTTPMLYFAQINYGSDSAVMITGSHNPSDMNGFKMITKDHAIYGEKIQYLKDLIIRNDLVTRNPDTPAGTLKTVSVKEDYLDYLKKNISMGDRSLKIVIDGGNGTGGEIAAEIFRHFGHEVTELYTKPDGTFPNHHPDPTVPKYMVDLIAKVKEIKADLGIGYDGDADRIGVVTEQGNMLFGDHLMLIFSKEILSRKPGATIVGEVKCSQTLYDSIKKFGGNGIMWKAGHSLIKAKMKETKAELGGEVSGHIFFKDRFFGHDDALYASLRLLEILSRTDKTVTGLLADVPKTIMTPEIRLDSDDNKKFDIVRKVTEFFKSEGYNVVDVDGVRVIFDDGFGLIRASNTQPALVQRYEAQSQERLEEIMKLMQDKLKEIEKRSVKNIIIKHRKEFNVEKQKKEVKKMTKFEIIRKVHVITGLSYKETGSVINNMIEVIKDSLKDDFVIELRGFGTFKVAERAARIAYKPKGREKLEIPEKRVPVFKAVKSLKDKVNRNKK